MPKDTAEIMEELKKQLPEMDIATGLNYCCGDEDFFISIVQEYLMSDRIQKLEQAFAASDWDNYKITAHSTKSTSRTVGLAELSDKFWGLETAAKNSDIDYIRKNHAEIMDELKRVIGILTSIVPPAEQ